MVDLEKALGIERNSADKELEELLEETDKELEELLEETEKVPLIDREWKEVSRDHLNDLAKDFSLRPLKVHEKKTKTTVIYQGDFGDIRSAIRIDEGTHNTVLAKCECSDKADCAHVLALWAAIGERKEAEKKEEKDVKDVKVEKRKEAKAEAKVDKIAKFASEIRGKLVVIYGQPYAGKTTLAHTLTRHFERTVYFKVDRNFSRDDFKHIAKNVYYIEISNPQQLLRELRSLARSPPQNALVVVDSVTSLDSFFVPSDPTTPSPRMENARAKFADAVMQLLSYVKGQNTVIVIAHEKIRDFKTEEIVPRFNVVALRHCDANYHIIVENNKRKVKKVRERKPVEKPDFDFS